ncbi:MAG TPA: response regulator [Phenylobacterium sp.]|jgi:signal transduction histidine kinase/ActR/RegA family two-component response regulator|uniref:response regulator n=1 Tax=Phenylobacterium sp. TaxID=1871053 RepID=UPI002CB2EB81|nr:response regulator [Phenylobacterium sp.]HXA40051.1 response regulator [Phenylobacterium sp.]
MRRTSRGTFRELVTGLGALVLAVVVQAAIVWSTIDRLEALDTADDEARSELMHYGAMLEALQEQESGLSGFALRGHPGYLQIYERARQRFEAGIPRMISQAADDPLFMRRRVEDVIQQARTWTETVAKPQIVAARAGDGRRDGPAGEAQLDAIRDDFAVLRHEELSLVDARDGQWGAAIWKSRLTLLLGSGAALAFAMVIAVRSLRRLIQQQRAAHAAAARLADALERAHAAERAKTVFLSNMSHEMRTPLNGVAGMAEALARTDLSPDQRNLLGVIRDSAATLDGLIGDLLTLSRGTAETRPLDRRCFGLGETVRHLAAEHRPPADLKGLRLETLIDPQAERSVTGDVARLEQLLSCLLSNAVKFTDRGHVRLVVEALGGARYRFEVADTGVGFDQARKAELFETFSQSDDSSTRRHGGAGLGLALARRLASELGGRLDCRSAPGEGSVFALEIELPADAEGGGGAAADTGPAAAPADAAPLRILVVDDHPTNRKVLELILDQLGVEWVSVEDGQQAVDVAAVQGFAAILMDIQMPVMDGLTATREIRRQERASGRAAVPVIIVSANGEPEHVQAGRAAGAQAHLPKPVSAEILAKALNAVLATPETRARSAAA